MSWVAICPKCERIMKLAEYRPEIFCAHPKDNEQRFGFTSQELPTEPYTEKIRCKILKTLVEKK